MPPTYDYDFIEQSILMAALSNDVEELTDLLRSMWGGERKALKRQLEAIIAEIDYLGTD